MKKITLVFLMLLGVFGTAFAQADLQVLAVVKYTKSESVTVKQLKDRCEIYRKQMGGKQLTVDEKKAILNTLIKEKLVLQAAAKMGISITNSQVDEYFLQNMSAQVGANVTEKELNDLIMQSQGVTLDQLLISQTNMNVTEYKAYIKNMLIIQQYIIAVKKDEIQKQVATDEEIRAFYEGNKKQFVQEDMLKLFAVVVQKGSNPDAAKTKVNDFRNKYIGKKMNADQIVNQSLHDQDFQAGEMIVPKSENSAYGLGMQTQTLYSIFNQSEGYVFDVQETPVDYRFYVILKKYPFKTLGLSDIAQPETTVTVYDYIRQVLTNQKQSQYLLYASEQVSSDLYKPEYVNEKKTGAELDKILDWGN